MRVSHPLSGPVSRSRKKKSPIVIVLSIFGILFVIGTVLFSQSVSYNVNTLTTGDQAKNVQVRGYNRLNQKKVLFPQQVNNLGVNPPRGKDDDDVEPYGDDYNDDGRMQGFVDLLTPLGKIRIVFLPEHATQSVAYVMRLAKAENCDSCEFYRSEKGQILQGVMKTKHGVEPNLGKGTCPDGVVDSPHKCPEWDHNCGCHGPIMTRGMVGWAGGGAGPDFFFNMNTGSTQELWKHEHTVWGQVIDDESLAVIMAIFRQPSAKEGQMTMLSERIPFTIQLED